MRFTVLIPLYNKATYIGDTLRSVLAQTCADFEVLVVDDGSTDGGAAVVESFFHDRRLSLVRQKNAGVAAARNFGISLARGEWVVFLDADDWHHPRCLESLLLAHERYPAADTLASDFVRVPDTSGEGQPQWPVLAPDLDVELVTDLPVRWMAGSTLCASSVAVRIQRLKSMQPCFPPGESRGEDLDLWFRLAERAPIALVHAPLAAYRVEVEGSLTTQKHPELKLAPFVHRMQARAESGELSAAQRKSALWMVAQYDIGMAREALAIGKRVESARWLIRGVRGITTKRWWVTATMILLFPGAMVKNWEHWRVSRTTPKMNLPVQDGK